MKKYIAILAIPAIMGMRPALAHNPRPEYQITLYANDGHGNEKLSGSSHPDASGRSVLFGMDQRNVRMANATGYAITVTPLHDDQALVSTSLSPMSGGMAGSVQNNSMQTIHRGETLDIPYRFREPSGVKYEYLIHIHRTK